MTTGFEPFMAGLIDYAGLFPPARLPLTEAFELYARYRQEPERWLLGRFIIPAAQLPALSDLAAERLAAAESPIPFSILGRGGGTAAAFLEGLAADLALITTFRGRHGAAVSLDLYEVRLPPLFARSRLLPLLYEATLQLTAAGLRPFFEPGLAPTDAEWADRITAVAAAIAPNGFKLRCGGVTADLFPTPDQIAHALVAARDAGVPLKATAGLHHPVRHFDAGVQAKMHGFFNLFGAGILAHVHNLATAVVAAILADEVTDHFQFGADGFTWRDPAAGRSLSASPAEIGLVRQYGLLSYGSCSFDEPRDDLRALGLL